MEIAVFVFFTLFSDGSYLFGGTAVKEGCDAMAMARAAEITTLNADWAKGARVTECFPVVMTRVPAA